MIRAGMMVWTSGPSTPADALLANGSVVSRTTYADLFAVIGTTFNIGGEAGTDFRLPNGTDRMLLGKAAAGTGSTLGGTGGTLAHTHTVANHIHTVVQPATHATHGDTGFHTHDAHTTTALVGSTGGTSFTGPSTHSNVGGHTHDAHSAHTGFATQSAGGATTAAGDPPFIRQRLLIYIRDTYAQVPVGSVVGYAKDGNISGSNYLTTPASDFEGATTGWASTNTFATPDMTLTSSTDQFVDGTRSMKLTSLVTGSNFVGATTNPLTDPRLLVEGQEYFAFAWVRANTTVRPAGLIMVFYSDTAGTVAIGSALFGEFANDSAAGWSGCFVTGQCPAGARSMRVSVAWFGIAIGEIHYTDAVVISEYDWEIANGSSLLRANYPALFTEIGTTYGSADATHFTLPNLRGRYLMGGPTLGATGGALDHTHSVASNHTHTVTQGAAHGTHSSVGAHTHDAHTTAAASTTLAITAVLTSPTTHNSQGNHTHDAHSAHTAAAAAAGGTGTTSAGNPPSLVVTYLVKVGPVTRQQFPVGSIHPFGSATIPTEYKLCDGTSELRADFPVWFAVQGTSFGAVDGTHFNRPNLVGRIPIGMSSGFIFANTFGAIDHTHAGPSHTHTATQPAAHPDHAAATTHTHDAHATTTRGVGVVTWLAGPATHAVNTNILHSAHSAHTGFAVDTDASATSTANPPFQVVNYIILWRNEITFSVTTEHVVSFTRQALLSREFDIITEHVLTFTRQALLSREFDVITEHLLSQSRQLSAFREFDVVTEHVVNQTRQLFASREFDVITEHVVSFSRQALLSREFDVITEHVLTFTRALLLARSFAIVTEHVLDLTKIVQYTREFDVVTEHVIKARIELDFDELPDGDCPPATGSPFYLIFDDF